MFLVTPVVQELASLASLKNTTASLKKIQLCTIYTIYVLNYILREEKHKHIPLFQP